MRGVESVSRTRSSRTLHTHFDKLKQTAGHRTDPPTPNTLIRAVVFRQAPPRFNPNSRRVFSLWERGQKTNEPILDTRGGRRSPLNLSFWIETPRKTNRLGIEFEVGRGHIIHNITRIGLTTWLCLMQLCHISAHWFAGGKRFFGDASLLQISACIFYSRVPCK